MSNSSKSAHYLDLGWSQKQYEAAQAAVQTFYRGRKPVPWHERKSDRPDEIRYEIARATRWLKTFKHARATGEFKNPDNGHVIAKWPMNERIYSNFSAVTGLTEAIIVNLQKQLGEAEQHA